jgi:hypothetical protein
VAKSDRSGVWGKGRNKIRPGATKVQSTGRDLPSAGVGRHFEGWQPGLVAVVLAGIVALLAVPRSVEPHELPLPVPDVQALRRVAQTDDDAAQAIQQKPLDADVRAVGSLLRAFGTADAARDDVMLVQLRSRISTAVLRARTQGDEQLVALRAFQMQAFLREVRYFVATGATTEDLVELGGSFAELLMRNEWCVGSRPCAMRMGEPALRALYKRRWNEISGLAGERFDLTLDEQRAFYEFLLRYPPRQTEGHDSASPTGFDGSYFMRKVDELSALDPAYPRLLARGIIQFRMGDFRRAAESFSTFLDTSPDGPWAIRAQNHLRAALEHTQVEPQ